MRWFILGVVVTVLAVTAPWFLLFLLLAGAVYVIYITVVSFGRKPRIPLWLLETWLISAAWVAEASRIVLEPLGLWDKK